MKDSYVNQIQYNVYNIILYNILLEYIEIDGTEKRGKYQNRVSIITHCHTLNAQSVTSQNQIYIDCIVQFTV